VSIISEWQVLTKKNLLFKNMLQFFLKIFFSKKNKNFCEGKGSIFLGIPWNIPFVGTIIQELQP